jgi:hypothetical protein
MKNKTNVVLNMLDSAGKKVTRTIDKLNAFSNGSVCWELRGPSEQRLQLERWINERGNEQHATKLTLIDWYFV